MTLHLKARRYLGVPFKHRGRDPQKGIDCAGLFVAAALDGGWVLEDLPHYSRATKDGVVERMLDLNFGPPVLREPVREGDLRPGDVVALHFDAARVKRRIRSAWAVRHIGIVGDHPHGLSLIHTASHIGRVVEQRIDEQILASIAAVYRRVA